MLPILYTEVKAPSVTSNIDEFEAAAKEYLANIPQLTKESTDEDFSLAETNVKALKAFEDGIKSRQEEIIKQCGELYEVLERTSAVSELARGKRLPLAKDVKTKKEEIKRFVLKTSRIRASAYVSEIQKRFKYGFTWDVFTFVPKNARNLKGYSNQLEDALEEYKAEIDARHDLLAARCKVFADNVGEYEYLFKDADKLIDGCDVSVLPDLIKSRITSHIAEQEAKKDHIPDTTKKVETKIVEEVDTETGEIIEVEKPVEMVSLDKAKLLDLMQDIGHELMCLGGSRSTLDRVERLVGYLSK